jgi:hypothetical protein
MENELSEIACSVNGGDLTGADKDTPYQVPWRAPLTDQHAGDGERDVNKGTPTRTEPEEITVDDSPNVKTEQQWDSPSPRTREEARERMRTWDSQAVLDPARKETKRREKGQSSSATNGAHTECADRKQNDRRKGKCESRRGGEQGSKALASRTARRLWQPRRARSSESQPEQHGSDDRADSASETTLEFLQIIANSRTPDTE